MSRPLPERPHLDHLRRQAKALRDAARAAEPDALTRLARHLAVRAGAEVTLSAAQFVIAREYGFAGWPRLKAEVDARTMTPPRRVAAFLAASVEDRPQQAARLLASDPRIARADVRTAAVLGDADHVRELTAADPALAVTPDAARGWPPLLYVCHSRWHRADPGRAAGLTEVARVLLDAGAGPDTNNGLPRRTGRYRSALYGAAGIADNPAITALLLERGADPDDDESLYHSVYHRDHACLRLLLRHGARVNGTNALAAATGAGDVEGVRLLVEAGGDPGRPLTAPAPAGHLADRSVNPLVAAAAGDTAAVVEILLAAGADPNAATREGISPVRQALRRGKSDVAELLLRSGAQDDTTAVDHFLGACLRADRADAGRLLADHPGLVDGLSDVDRAAIGPAAGRASLAAVALMLDLGFPVDARDENGETPLHEAAYAGRADVVALLLDRGAEVDSRDVRWNSTPLCFATVGSGERPGDSPDGDWVATVRTLLDAGAAHRGVWIDGKPPSEDVAALLYGHGITGEDEPEDPPADPGPAPDPRVMAELADRLRAALDTGDPDLLAGLLHPAARWAGCTDRGQVLDWYRARHAAGLRVRVGEVVVHGDGIVLGMTVEGPGADSPDVVYQVFRTVDGMITDISGHPGKADALAALASRPGAGGRT